MSRTERAASPRAREELAHSGSFVLRAPLLPFATLESLPGDRAVKAWEAGEELAGPVAADRAELADALRELVADPVVRDAIAVASPDLDEQLDEWLAGSGASDDDRVLRSVLSYLTRMAGRSTPFGLFAACGAGQVGGATDLRLPGPDGVRRRTRLDYGFLAKLVGTLATDPVIRDQLRYEPNSSLYQAGGRLRMAEARVDAERGLRYHRVAIEEDEALALVLDRARGGARLHELADALVDDEVTVEEARAYVDELVEAQLLLPRLGPVVTGADALGALVETLSECPGAASVTEVLAAVRADLADLDAGGAGASPDRYRQLAERLRVLDPDVTVARLVQVDAAWAGTQPVLGDAVVDEILRAVDALRRLDPGAGEDDLSRFRDAFVQRYEGREVPLAEALDEEIGVGFGPPPGLAAQAGPLLAGLAGGGAPGAMRWGRADEHRLRLLTAALTEGRREVELTPADVDRLAAASPRPLPDSTAAFGTVLGDSPEAVARGELEIFLHVVSGPPGARMLGRFCDVDPAIEQVVRAHVDDEQRACPDATLAEVVHLPEGRLGNILARPVLREYEIPFLGTSGAPDDRLLPLDDLLVSVEGDRVVLRSRRLGREVLPRLTTAHNLRGDTLAVYRFLGALQTQGVAANLGWGWGVLDGVPFLPRVTLGRVVLERARWQLTGDELKPVREARGPAAAYAAVQRLRTARDLPRWVAIAMADNELAVDLTTVAGVELLAHEARRGGSLRLVELLDRARCATSPRGAHAHEFVLPLVRRTPRQLSLVTSPAAGDGVQRDFAPGSAWLTVKLYAGIATAESVLRDVVAPVVAELREHGVVDRWFFIRYTDPEHHLRLRLHGEPRTLAAVALPTLHERVEPLLDDGRLAKVVFDTYRREVERYGGPAAIELAESVFAADSDAALLLVRLTAGEDGLDTRWRLALRGVDGIFGMTGLGVAERRAMVRQMRDSFVAEQGDLGDAAKRHAGRLWRREREALGALLSGGEVTPALATGRSVLDRRDEALAPLGARLRELAAAGTLARPVEHVLGSFTHMHVNRLLRGAQRTQELVVYDLLDRHYAAVAARGRTS